MPQRPAPIALAAAADVTSAVIAVEFATARAQEDPAEALILSGQRQSRDSNLACGAAASGAGGTVLVTLASQAKYRAESASPLTLPCNRQTKGYDHLQTTAGVVLLPCIICQAACRGGNIGMTSYDMFP